MFASFVPVGGMLQYAGSIPPSGWLSCQGQTLNISDYSSLFNVIGNVYGGDGVTTFGLPDLRGRIPLGMNNSYSLGSTGGSETHTLAISEMPSHNHTGTINSVGDHTHTGTVDSVSGHTHTYQDAYFAENTGATPKVFGLSAGSDWDNNFYYRKTDGTSTSNPNDSGTQISTSTSGAHTHSMTNSNAGSHTHTMTNSSTGGGQSFSIMQPYLSVSYIIKY
jgi:microcystin-dependent protein